MSNGTQYAYMLLKRMQRRKEDNKAQREKIKRMHRTAYYHNTWNSKYLFQNNLTDKEMELLKEKIRNRINKERLLFRIIFIFLSLGLVFLFVKYVW